MEQLKSMKQCLVAAAQSQMGNLANADAEELGEVIDMIKDLEEAIYYCTITKAMEQKEDTTHNNYYYTEYREPNYWDDPRMYYNGNGGRQNGSSNTSGGSNGMGNSSSHSYYSEREYRLQDSMRDRREGKSPMMRKAYMESKEIHKDKATQLKDLENYMQELTADITEMIEGASAEEKQLLQKKIATLANKI